MGAGQETFRYDLLGNRAGDGTGGQYGYVDTRPDPDHSIAYGANNKANDYTTISSNGVSHDVLYDAAGNLILDEDGLGYGYDAENRMVRVFEDVDRDGVYDDPGDTQLVEYKHDALGRRIEKADWTQGQPPPLRTRFVYDGLNVIEEVGTDGVLKRYFINGPTYIDERVLVYNAATEQEHYYLLKELYSVAGLADQDGKLVEAYSYDAYGKVQVYQGSSTSSGDADGDQDVDLRDLALFQQCFGEDMGLVPGCEWADLVGTGNDVDLDDFTAFLECFNGPTDYEPLPCSGDYNSNGVIDERDAEALEDCLTNRPTDADCLVEYDSTQGEEQVRERWFVHGPSFPDPLVMVDLTDLGEQPAGENEYLYHLKDLLGSVTALANGRGAVMERHVYGFFARMIVRETGYFEAVHYHNADVNVPKDASGHLLTNEGRSR